MEGVKIVRLGIRAALLSRPVFPDEHALELVAVVGALVEGHGVLAFELELVELARPTAGWRSSGTSAAG